MKILEITIILLALIAPLFITGCNTSTTAELVTTLGNAAASIATLEGQPALATKLQTDVAAASTAITNWKTGTPAQDVIEALNIVEDDLNLFPQTAEYAPLITLAIGTVDSILEIVQPSAASPNVTTAHRSVTLASPPKTARQFKKAWNAIVSQNPNLSKAKL